jgi:1,4-dihydroxy-2-naphthoate octaprenyltransferase
MSLKTWLLETRPSFLLLTPLNFSVGLAAAFADGSFHLFKAILGLVGVLLAHIAMNVINDYFDHTSGLDMRTTKTPFSGGSGILQSGELNPKSVYILAVVCLLFGGAIGIYFAYTVGWEILPVIILAALTIYAYTDYLSHWYVGEFVTGLNFGFLMAVGAYFIMAGRYSVSSLVPAVIPGVLGSTLLFINEFPDIKADSEFGRRNLVMKLGLEKASKVYGLLVASPYVWVLTCVLMRLMPVTMLLVFLSLPLGLKAAKGARENYDDIPALIPALGANVLWILSTTLLTSIGLLVQIFLPL